MKNSIDKRPHCLSARCHRDDSDKVVLPVRYKFVDRNNICKKITI